MDRKSCPKCNSNMHVVELFSCRPSLQEWPLMLIFTGIIMIYGDLLGLNAAEVLWFSALAVFPLCFQKTRKKSCLHCHIDFQSSDELAEEQKYS